MMEFYLIQWLFYQFPILIINTENNQYWDETMQHL